MFTKNSSSDLGAILEIMDCVQVGSAARFKTRERGLVVLFWFLALFLVKKDQTRSTPPPLSPSPPITGAGIQRGCYRYVRTVVTNAHSPGRTRTFVGAHVYIDANAAGRSSRGEGPVTLEQLRVRCQHIMADHLQLKGKHHHHPQSQSPRRRPDCCGA